MSEFLRYKYLQLAPTPEDVVQKIRDCRTVLGSNVNGAPLCQGESLTTVEDFSHRYAACMECHTAVSNARGLVGHPDSNLKEAFAHIDGVVDACTAALGAVTGPIPPPVYPEG